MTPILLVGAGRMGGALLAGWLKAKTFAPADLMIRDPAPGPEARRSGARFVSSPEEIAEARTVVLAVKPQGWRTAAQEIAPDLAADAVIVSICAGVPLSDLRSAFRARRVARVMPTIAAAIGRGTASVFAPDPDARARARALFAPVGVVVELADEDLMHAATAVSGSGPAYVYAFVEALEAAGAALGLPREAARVLARATAIGAAALMDATGETPEALRRQVTSPGGTTEAALARLLGDRALGTLVGEAAAAAEARSRSLGS